MSERRVRKALYANVNVSKRGKHGVCVCACVRKKEREREDEKVVKINRLSLICAFHENHVHIDKRIELQISTITLCLSNLFLLS